MRARGAACMARSKKYTCQSESGRNTVSLINVAAAAIVGSSAVTPTRNAVRRRLCPAARASAYAGNTALDAHAAFSQPMAVICAAVVLQASAGRMHSGYKIFW